MRSINITLMNTRNTMKHVTLTVPEIDRICGPINEASVDLEGYKHLKDLVLADSPAEWHSEGIDALIGMDHYHNMTYEKNSSGY